MVVTGALEVVVTGALEVVVGGVVSGVDGPPVQKVTCEIAGVATGIGQAASSLNVPDEDRRVVAGSSSRLEAPLTKTAEMRNRRGERPCRRVAA